MNERKDVGEADKEKRLRFDENTVSVFINKFVEVIREGYLSDFFEKNELWLLRAGFFGLYVLAVIGLITAVSVPIRYDGFSFWFWFFGGLGWVLFCAGLHYAAYKMLPSLVKLIESTPTKLSSYAFLECSAVAVGISGMAALIGGIWMSIASKSFEVAIGGAFLFILSQYLMALLLKPSLVNVARDDMASAGEEFVGLVSFVMKAQLKLAPIFFGSGVGLAVLFGLDLLFFGVQVEFQLFQKISLTAWLASAALIPIVSYIIFLIYYFLIDIASSILTLRKTS